MDGNEGMLPSANPIARSLSAVVVACAILIVAPATRAATLGIEYAIDYATQTPTSATGTLQVDVRFMNLDAGETGPFEYCSVQILLSQIIGGTAGVGASFTLDEASTESTQDIVGYWIDNQPSLPTGHENASTQAGGSQFRFFDFVAPVDALVPTAGDVLARYVIDFVAGPDGLGEYMIGMGDADQNHFRHFEPPFTLVTYPNTMEPVTFVLTPEPSVAAFFLFAGLVVLRRRRTSRV